MTEPLYLAEEVKETRCRRGPAFPFLRVNRQHIDPLSFHCPSDLPLDEGCNHEGEKIDVNKADDPWRTLQVDGCHCVFGLQVLEAALQVRLVAIDLQHLDSLFRLAREVGDQGEDPVSVGLLADTDGVIRYLDLVECLADPLVGVASLWPPRSKSSGRAEVTCFQIDSQELLALAFSKDLLRRSANLFACLELPLVQAFGQVFQCGFGFLDSSFTTLPVVLRFRGAPDPDQPKPVLALLGAHGCRGVGIDPVCAIRTSDDENDP